LTLPTLYTEKPRLPEWIALAVILILAAALRLGMPDVVEFKRDEANLSLLALNMAHGQGIPLLGITSSIGVNNAPVNVYVLVPPYLFSSDPVLATQYIGLLNVIGVLLTYLLARRYYNPGVALVAALFFAVGPWAVVFSRKIWSQDMLPIFVVMTVGTGLLGFLEGKRWAQLVHLPLLALTGQIHYVTFVLIPITLYLMFVGRRRLSRVFLIGLALALLSFVPFIIGAIQALIPILWMVPKAIEAGGQGHSLGLTGTAIQYAVLSLAGTDIHAFAGQTAFQQYLASVPDAYPFFNAFALVVLLSGGWLIVRAVRRRDARRPFDVVVVLWLFFTPLIFSVTWSQVQIHYMIPIFPAACIALGSALSDLWSALAGRAQVRRAVFALVGAGLALVAVLQIWLQVALLTFVNTNATPNGFGTPLGYLAPVRDTILAAHPAQVLARLDGQFVGNDEDSTVWAALLYDVPQVRFLADGIDVFPAQDALYLSRECAADGQVFKLRPLIDSSHAPEGCYTLRPRQPADFDSSFYTALPDMSNFRSFANGARVIGYRWAPETGCLSTAWTVEKPASGPKSDQFNVAVKFINAQGQEILNADNAFWLGRYWQAGDRITRRFCLTGGQERIPEITGVRLGMYTLEDSADGRHFYNEDVLDATGTPGGQWLEVPLVKK
jgi:hypothetical protein